MKKTKIWILTLIMFILMINVAFAQPRSGYGTPYVTYNSPLGVKFVSFSSRWGTQAKLEQVYQEFTKNLISSEVGLLNAVYLYPDTPDGVAGFYRPSITVDSRGNYKYGQDNYIEIFDVNSYNELSDIAKVLSHEYGHHFTMYYLVSKENKYFSDWKDTGYARVRKLTNFPKIKYYENMYGAYEHRWDVTEIAAEDYLQLFGSPLAKKSVSYIDVKDRLINNVTDYRYTSNTFNLIPQENLDIPLATEVSGLREYWLGLAGMSQPKVTFPDRPKIVLSEEKKLLNKYNSYKIDWNEIGDGKSYEYTLVLYPEGDNSFPVPIKTVKSGEGMSAYIGSYVLNQPGGGARVIMENFTGKYLLRLFIKDSNNFMFSSSEYRIDFSKTVNGALQAVYGPNEGDKTGNNYEMFSDMGYGHWAYRYVVELVNSNFIKGYSDGTYKPENKITKGEFIALTMRTLKINLNPYKKESNDWFIKDGYMAAAKGLGLIKESDYGTGYKDFKSTDAIKREEVAFIVARAMNGKAAKPGFFEDYVKNFTDIQKVKYRNELNFIVKHDIISGYPDKSFKPANTATRAEASKIISKLKSVIK